MSRAHHYLFAHKVLPQLFFDNPVGFLETLIDRGESLLADLWNDVGNKVGEVANGQTPLPPEGLGLHLNTFPDRMHLAVVSLPTPREAPEAYFAAMMVWTPQKRFWGLFGKTPPRARYLTLEKAESDSGTMICEWLSGGGHANLGPGPEPDLDEFIEWLEPLG